MNGFELRAVDTPLLRRNAQPIENRGQIIAYVPALVAAHDAPGPVDQGQVVLEAERYAGLGFGWRRHRWRIPATAVEPGRRSIVFGVRSFYRNTDPHRTEMRGARSAR